MLKVRFNDVKDEIIKYTDFDYELQQMALRANIFGNIDVAYKYFDSILIKVPAKSHNIYYVLNSGNNIVCELQKICLPNDMIFFSSDISAPSSFALLSQKISFYKYIDNVINDIDVCKLTTHNDTEVRDFLNISKSIEEENMQKSEALGIVNTLLNTWQKKAWDTVQQYYCIRSQNSIAGIIAISGTNMLPNKISVDHIYISPLQREKGLGKRLLLASISAAAPEKYMCYYNCRKNNIASINTAQSAGFYAGGAVSVLKKV